MVGYEQSWWVGREDRSPSEGVKRMTRSENIEAMNIRERTTFISFAVM